jgi:hypothetical protein
MTEMTSLAKKIIKENNSYLIIWNYTNTTVDEKKSVRNKFYFITFLSADFSKLFYNIS